MADVGGQPEKTQPRSDVYTVLLIIATVFVALGTAYLAFRSQDLYGTWLPTPGV